MSASKFTKRLQLNSWRGLVGRNGGASRDVELDQVSRMETRWQKSKWVQNAKCEDILEGYASKSTEEAMDCLSSSIHGLSGDEAACRLLSYGSNILSSNKPPTWWQLILSVLPNPFNILLTILAIISAATPPPNWSTFAILVIMIVISCTVRFWQEYRGNVEAVKLQNSTSTTVQVRRPESALKVDHHLETAVDERDLVPGDVIHINPGDSVPADCLVIEASHLQISQSSLMGESEPLRKTPSLVPEKISPGLFERENLLFMGTSVISGSGLAVVLTTGDGAFIATIMKELNKKRPVNAFQRGVRHVSYLMITFMLIMVPIVLVVSGKSTGNWSAAALFALSVAVGVVPEMLPAIVNANLARGAFALSKKKAIVKRLDAIQNMGGMSVLCSDKTGTLTKDEIALRHHLDCFGASDNRVLQLGYINASNQSGKKNTIDSAVVRYLDGAEKSASLPPYEKVAEIPFTFEKRRSSCIVRNTNTGKLLLICKGAFEEVSALCPTFRKGVESVTATLENRQELLRQVTVLNNDGFRVILVATKEIDERVIGDEESLMDADSDMTTEGLLTFLDPPKEDAAPSIHRLQTLGVEVKVLTGDNLGVAMKVCRSLDLIQEADEGAIQAISGPDLEKLEGTDEYDEVLKTCRVLAKLTPNQKGDVVLRLKAMGKCVGFLGDGINDSVALRFADVGISVDTGANVAKECADVILTEKALGIIVDCVTTGRITHGNTIKYIKMVASSNFGNVFSILIASAWLPFEPMTALQILIQNLLYDISQIAIPWDRMDEEYLLEPHQWNTKDLLRFIIVFGPTSSTIDMCTFCLNWFYYGIRTADDPTALARFHTHWFLEGLLTQTLIVHLLRTAKVPVFQSRAAKVLVITTVTIMLVGFLFPYIPPFAHALLFVRPANSFIGFLVAELVLYCVEVQVVKMFYVKCTGIWL